MVSERAVNDDLHLAELSRVKAEVAAHPEHLDRFLLERVMAGHTDRITLSEGSPARLRRMMMRSIRSANTVGVRGIDASGNLGDVSKRLAAIDRDIRGGVGVYRAIAVMLDLAREGVLVGKTVASAHLYFGLLSGLDECIEASQGVLCITSRPSVAASIRARHAKPVDLIQTGTPGPPDGFLHRVREEMPQNLGGNLVLIGGGVWSEAYCHWAKERGGLAVDIGSGFDLLAGKRTRPIHHRLMNP